MAKSFLESGSSRPQQTVASVPAIKAEGRRGHPLQRTLRRLPVGQDRDFGHFLPQQESQQVHYVHAGAHQRGGSADKFRLLPPLAAAGSGWWRRVSPHAKTPLALGQGQIPQGSLPDGFPRQDVTRMGP